MVAALGAVLEIPSAACQEAALLGLGHAHFGAPAETERLIDRYLEWGAAARPCATRARGCVNRDRRAGPRSAIGRRTDVCTG